MIKLSEILDPRHIRLSMKAHKKKDAIEELVTILHESGKIGEVQTLVKELLEREKMASTGIGEGIAIPHKLIPGLNDTLMVFGRKKEGVNFDSLDNKPATLFFLILGPEGHNVDHLRLLSKLARILRDPRFRETLQDAGRPEDIISAIRKQEEE